MGNILYILNNTINNGANWEIKAESTKVNFILNFPVTQFEPTQELKFSVNVPFIHGNLTFIFIDALGFEAYYEEKEVISSDTSFIYDIPSNPHKGDCKVYVFWINDLEAGVQPALD